MYVQTINDCGLSPILNWYIYGIYGTVKKETEPLFTSYTMANLYWASLYSRFSTECIVWFQKRDIRQVSSGWKKNDFPALSANLLTPPAHRLLFRKRCKEDSVFMSARRGERYPPWFGKREGISFSLQSHAVKSNQTLRKKPFWRPWPWLNWPSL